MSGRRSGYKPRGRFGSKRKVSRSTNPRYAARRFVGNASAAMPRMGALRGPSLKETHYIDFVALNSGSVGTSWTTLPLCDAPVQGSTANDRYGNSLTIRAIECWVVATGVADSPTDYYNDMRVIFGFFKAPRGSGAPTASGVNGVMDTTTLSAPMTPYSQEFRQNWTLIKDQTYKLSTYSTAAAPYTTISSGADGRNFNQSRHYMWKFPRGVVCRTQANAGSAGDWETNIPFFCYGSDSGAVSHPTLLVRTRMFFDP